MKINLAVSMAVLALTQGVTAAALAQTAPASTQPPAPPRSAARDIIDMQLHTPPTAPARTSGAEADAIHKRYMEELGKPMKSTITISGNSQGGGGQ